MQLPLFLETSNRIITPLKSQLLKWIGNKQRYAKEIVSYFPNRFRRYFEPFLGSGAVLATLVPDDGIGSDNFKPLMEIWRTLKKDPNLLNEWYLIRWEKCSKGEKTQEYEKIKESYNKNPNGADLLFLSRSCYGGVVRFRKADGCISTPCGIHDPIKPNSFAKRVDEWSSRIKGTEFLILDYNDAMDMANAGDLIYCDPPYKFTQNILYGAQDFNLEDLYASIEKCRSRGAYVALSIDGSKKSGDYLCKISIPKDLFKREMSINCGRSMLRRFQLNGKTLESEVVSDRLLLTY